MTPSRRQFVQFAVGAGALAAATTAFGALPARAADATVLDGTAYAAKFTRALPRPRRIDLAFFGRSTTLTATQVQQQVLTGYPATTCYAWGGSWPGPTIIARAGRPVQITWRNGLPIGGAALKDGGHLLPVDATLLDDTIAALPAGQLPVVTHLHGAHAEWQSDGHTQGWYTQDGTHGEKYVKQTYTYDNSQRGTGLWYHDHTMGITRLNVGAGLVGAYLIRDSAETGLVLRGVLPDPLHEQELMIQDRSFTSDGQFSMPNVAPPAPPGAPAGTPGAALDFFGDFMMVNGAPWPTMSVEQRKYRFRLMNGCDSRALVLKVDSAATMIVVGSDQGLLPTAAATTQLVIAPGERYDVVVDFTGVSRGTAVTMTNIGPDNNLIGWVDASSTVTNRATDTPFTNGFGAPGQPPTRSTTPANPASTGVVMRFTVDRARGFLPNARVKDGTPLLGRIPALTATRTRSVMTAFVPGPGGGMEMLGSLEQGTANYMDPVTEQVALGTTEIWEVYNTGPVAHPIHLHLVDFQVLDRASFTSTSTSTTMADGSQGTMITVTGTGTRRAPEAWELGRKDTVICYPNEVTRIVANFDRTGDYVWHCHLLHHEDHGMMRPLVIS